VLYRYFEGLLLFSWWCAEEYLNLFATESAIHDLTVILRGDVDEARGVLHRDGNYSIIVY
jgi:hypothetical protein